MRVVCIGKREYASITAPVVKTAILNGGGYCVAVKSDKIAETLSSRKKTAVFLWKYVMRFVKGAIGFTQTCKAGGFFLCAEGRGRKFGKTIEPR